MHKLAPEGGNVLKCILVSTEGSQELCGSDGQFAGQYSAGWVLWGAP